MTPYGLTTEQVHAGSNVLAAVVADGWLPVAVLDPEQEDGRIEGDTQTTYLLALGTLGRLDRARGFQSAAMNSFDHYSLGSVGEWLFGRVAGVDQAPGSVAYRDLLLRPTPGGKLTWARAEQETARGLVSCGWALGGDQLTVVVAVPPGSTAVLEIPTPDPGSVRANGAPVAAEPSTRGATVRLSSGRFTFTATSY